LIYLAQSLRHPISYSFKMLRDGGIRVKLFSKRNLLSQKSVLVVTAMALEAISVLFHKVDQAA